MKSFALYILIMYIYFNLQVYRGRGPQKIILPQGKVVWCGLRSLRSLVGCCGVKSWKPRRGGRGTQIRGGTRCTRCSMSDVPGKNQWEKFYNFIKYAAFARIRSQYSLISHTKRRRRQRSHRSAVRPTTAPHHHQRRGDTTTSPREDTGRSVRVVGRVFVIGRSGLGPSR